MTQKKIIITVLLLAVLTGCETTPRKGDSPNDIDNLKISPCVCVPLEYDGRGYQWIG